MGNNLLEQMDDCRVLASRIVQQDSDDDAQQWQGGGGAGEELAAAILSSLTCGTCVSWSTSSTGRSATQGRCTQWVWRCPAESWGFAIMSTTYLAHTVSCPRRSKSSVTSKFLTWTSAWLAWPTQDLPPSCTLDKKQRMFIRLKDGNCAFYLLPFMKRDKEVLFKRLMPD